MYFLFFEEIGLAIEQAIRTLIGLFAAMLYSFIVDLYDVFNIIARADLLDNEYIQGIYNRVGLILGLFMVFKLSFSLIQSLIDPNKFTDKKNGFASIIVRSVIAIVLLGTTPFIFRTAKEIQNLVIGSSNDTTNVIYKLVVADETPMPASSFGRRLAGDLYFSFFTESEKGILYNGTYSYIDESGDHPEKKIYQLNYDTLHDQVVAGDVSFYSLIYYLTLRKNGSYVMQWDIVFSIVTALAVIWILINYCIAVATRVVQLAYLQLVAPVPILSYIGDPDGAFKRWLKQCTTTYLDLFLRLAILYFIITLCGKILVNVVNVENFEKLNVDLVLNNPGQFKWVKIFILIGLLMFGKRVPELLKELFPSNGGAASLSMGVKSPKKLFADIPGLKGATGFAAGALTGGAIGLIGGRGVGGRISGLFGGLTKGGISGAKGTKIKDVAANRAAMNKQQRINALNGSTWAGRFSENVLDKLGLENTVEALDRDIHNIDLANRGIDDQIQRNDLDPRRLQKQRNDAVLAAYDKINERARKELLSENGRFADSQLKGIRDRLNYMRLHVGEIDPSSGRTITQRMVAQQEAGYNGLLDRRARAFANAHINDFADIAESMQKARDHSDVPINNFDDLVNERRNIRSRNVGLSAALARLDDEKEDLNRQKEANNRRKEELNRRKIVPQANIDANKNKRGK